MSRKYNDYVNQWSHFKRLFELCIADPTFYKEFISNPDEVARRVRLAVDVAMAKDSIKNYISGIESKPRLFNPYTCLTHIYVRRAQAAIRSRANLDNIRNQNFRAWFLRRRDKAQFDSYKLRNNQQFEFIPICFELSHGCSGECEFCCLNPPRFSGNFVYNLENGKLWWDVLGVCSDVVGRVVCSGACYFATEPFDNPDYERFIIDFHRMFGHYPQTTTVKALEDVNRTKGLLRLIGDEQLRNAVVRFSVISKKQLEKIHSTFSPKEIESVELLLNNPESMNGYTLAGRAFQLQGKLPTKRFFTNTTSVCVLGFVVNMYQQSIKLVSPRNPCAHYPNGMRTHEVTYFADKSSFESSLHKLIDKWMKQEIQRDERLVVDTEYERKENYLTFRGDRIHRTIGASETLFQSLKLFSEGYTMGEAIKKRGIPVYEQARLSEFVQMLYDFGYIDIA